MGGYWYVEGADGHHFCWSKVPTFECPNADGLDAPDGIEPVDGIDGRHLSDLIKYAHRRYSAGRARVDGRLTNQCSVCGVAMTRLGFRAWETKPRNEEDSRSRVAERLGFDNHDPVGETKWCRTKKQAEEWARSRARKSREAVA